MKTILKEDKRGLGIGDIYPGRPISLKESKIDLREFNCSAVEHIGYLYRLYYYGKEAKGSLYNRQSEQPYWGSAYNPVGASRNPNDDH